MNSFFRDVGFGVRMLRKSPGVSLIALLSLSVGIAVNSTVFGFVNAVMFKPMPVQNTEGLVYVFAGDSRDPYRNASYPTYVELCRQNEVFSGLAAQSAPPVLLTTNDRTEEINSEVVSGNYFSVLDVHMQSGRPLTVEDDDISVTEPAVMISDAFWKRRLNRNAEIVGTKLILNGKSFSVIGIAPPGFTGTDPTVSTDVWIPLTLWATIIQRTPTTGINASEGQPDNNEPEVRKKEQSRLTSDEGWLGMIGRLKPDVSQAEALAAIATIAARLEDGNKAPNEKFKVTLSAVSQVHPAIREEFPVALFIMAATGLILVICCVNVASLMLARAAARQKEFAVRIALGVSRRRLVQQLLTESLLLSLTGGLLGVLLAYWTTSTLLGLAPAGSVAFTDDIATDQRVLWFSFVISVLTTLIFGLAPALNSFRVELVSALTSEGMSRGGVRKKINLRRALVVVQIVASLVLLISAGLFLRGSQKGQATNASFRSDRILVLNLSPKQYGYKVNYSKTFYRELLDRMGHIPGVEAVTLSNVVPLTMNQSNVTVGINGSPIRLQRAVVAEGYFQTLKVPILVGREFNQTDDDRAHRVVIINETMARTYWPGENPLGKLIEMGGAHEIVGVAKDTPYNSFGRASTPFLYGALYQRPNESVSLIVRTSVEPKTTISAIQRETKALGGDLPIFDFQTLDEVSKSQLIPLKAAAALLSLLSFIGLVVGSIGIYGVTAYAFSQRRREIGIRMAFGAERTDILRLIMKEGMTLSVIGIVVGLLIALGTTHFLSSFIFGVSPVDPAVFVSVAALLGILALAASLAPAVLAARSNPVEVLRHE